jgi:hypothetical protein
MVSGVKGDVYPSSLPHQFSRLLSFAGREDEFLSERGD